MCLEFNIDFFHYRKLSPPAPISHTHKIKYLIWCMVIPWRRAWQPIPIFLSGESLGQRNLVGSYPKGHKETDTTEVTKHPHAWCMVHFKDRFWSFKKMAHPENYVTWNDLCLGDSFSNSLHLFCALVPSPLCPSNLCLVLFLVWGLASWVLLALGPPNCSSLGTHSISLPPLGSSPGI